MENEQYLIFSVGKLLFGMPILDVKEVLEPKEVVPVPNDLNWMIGITNLRGEVVKVMDLRIYFAQNKEKTKEDAFLLVESKIGKICILVDALKTIQNVKIDKVTDQAHEKIDKNFLIGVTQVQNGKSVILIDMIKMIDTLV